MRQLSRFLKRQFGQESPGRPVESMAVTIIKTDSQDSDSKQPNPGNGVKRVRARVKTFTRLYPK